ncbi:MAG: hydrogenase maturation protease [Acidimicrobiales bacterium]|nr:hydrogenase maturation protease [Acidimicrobiales bacterium]
MSPNHPPPNGLPAVIVIGSVFRHDDGVGPHCRPLIEAELRKRSLCAEVIELDGEPTRLLESWANRPLAVVVDAVRTGAPPGTVHVVAVGGSDWLGELAPSGTTASSHALGITEAYALGSALGRLPDRLVLAGVEGLDFTEGVGISQEVCHALPTLVERVADLIGTALGSARATPKATGTITIRTTGAA